jgi:hypothetical protein
MKEMLCDCRGVYSDTRLDRILVFSLDFSVISCRACALAQNLLYHNSLPPLKTTTFTVNPSLTILQIHYVQDSEALKLLESCLNSLFCTYTPPFVHDLSPEPFK